MKTIFTIIITTCLALNAQTAEQIKKQLQDVGITPDQAKQMSKDLGINNQQIETEARTRGIDGDLQSAEPEIQPVGNLQGEDGSNESTGEFGKEDERYTQKLWIL